MSWNVGRDKDLTYYIDIHSYLLSSMKSKKQYVNLKPFVWIDSGSGIISTKTWLREVINSSGTSVKNSIKWH